MKLDEEQTKDEKKKIQNIKSKQIKLPYQYN